ncbi:prepilin peptidase type IV [Gottschalkia acidurici 9a]|uniref:Prepilin leader peptidase/N-methyltransferase n=1 Tax=Gottschalkia acidurici (strain ATCC 7906 / DSM 604 / BCRC 14475 / CIP 104303 / KCTC 5404 / NCIMB 10678 / 9a) TaxID=1128398 RepID=K0AYE2_GOTA9|nr:A24 family peptidase [Gottschalkia acidurici]AFS78279.1 prepilin peptidase type IV [Gottschalkia acidurici 9a]
MTINYILIFMLGTVVGSFLNVCIYRIPRNMSIAYPTSQCPNCNSKLSPRDLIPILSYLIYVGKCRYCKVSISYRYPTVELICGFGVLILAYRFGFEWNLLINLLLFLGLVVCSFIDIDLRIIPDKVLMFLLVCGTILISVKSKELLLSGIIGLAVGSTFLLLLAMFYKDGLGGGDIKLVGVIGLYLGWQNVLMTIWIASILGVITFVILYIFKQKSLKDMIPFGPSLAIGAFISMIFGEELLQIITNGICF